MIKGADIEVGEDDPVFAIASILPLQFYQDKKHLGTLTDSIIQKCVFCGWSATVKGGYNYAFSLGITVSVFPYVYDLRTRSIIMSDIIVII